MIRVMIVEDEPPILRDIKKCIEAVNDEFSVTACATNGHQAISLLEKELPDVIFTDIQMPVVDGLELIQHVRDRNLDIEMVILSGYSEFSYAKKAMSLGISDYLLKPLNLEELSCILDKLSKKVHQKNDSQEREYIGKLLAHQDASTGEDCRKLHEGPYLVLLLCVGSFPTDTLDYHSPRRDFWKQNDLDAIVAGSLENNPQFWIFDGKTFAEKVAIINLEEDCHIDEKTLAGRILSKLRGKVFPVTLVMSSKIGKVSEIGRHLQELRLTLRKSLVIGLSQIITVPAASADRQNLHQKQPHIESLVRDRFILYAQQGEISLLKSDIYKLFMEWEAQRYPQIWVEALLRELIAIYRQALPIPAAYNWSNEDMDISEAISISNNHKELFESIWQIFEGLLDLRSQTRTQKDSMEVLMLKIDKYICSHLSEPISNQTLSDLFGLVPSYLSKLFREYKGVSPTDYLVSLRIDRAKKLIEAQPEFFAKDVAAAIGYSDPLYFSKIFKKETGMSPSEYRSSLSAKS